MDTDGSQPMKAIGFYPIMLRSRLLVLVNFAALQFFDFGVDGSELAGPLGVVEEGPVLEPVVVGAVGLRVVGWGQDGHLMAVDRVAPEKVFYLVNRYRN